MNKWATDVVRVLQSVFPTELEANTFQNPHIPLGAVSGDYNYSSLVLRFGYFVRGLDTIRQNNIPKYTDFPQKPRLYIEDIDSFRKARDINPAMVSDLLSDGYLDRSEDFIQNALEGILTVPLHKNDWGGELNDLSSANVIVNGARTETAFMLKGSGLRKSTLEIRDCGAQGDQLVRLFRSPAKLFIIQFAGNNSENVISDVDSKVQALRGGSSREAYYCMIDGQDTARLLRAYGNV